MKAVCRAWCSSKLREKEREGENRQKHTTNDHGCRKIAADRPPIVPNSRRPLDLSLGSTGYCLAVFLPMPQNTAGVSDGLSLHESI